MGIILPPEPDPAGNDCVCWDAGETPAIVYAAFGGIVRNPLAGPLVPTPPNRTFELAQSDGDPCVFTYNGDVWDIIYRSRWDLGGGRITTQLRCSNEPGMFAAFVALIEDPCHVAFINANLEIDLMYHGAAWILWKR